MEKNDNRLLIVLILILMFFLNTYYAERAFAQSLFSSGPLGYGVPYFRPFSSSPISPLLHPFAFTRPWSPYYAPLPSSLIRPPDLLGRYQGVLPSLNITKPLMSFPQPIIRRLNAITTITTLKVLLPPGVNTVVLNPFQSPVIVPISSLIIPVTPTQVQPILLNSGLTTQVTPTSALILNTLSPFLQAPILTTILPPAIGGLLTIVP